MREQQAAGGVTSVTAVRPMGGGVEVEHPDGRTSQSGGSSDDPHEWLLATDPMAPSGEVARRWAYIVAAVAPLAFAGFMLRGSLELGLGTMAAPGPGLWPFALSVALVGLSLALLAGGTRFGPCEAWGAGAMRMAIGAASAAPFIVLVPHVGFELPAVALLTFWFKALGGGKWLLSIIVATGTVVVLHVLFIEVLGTSIPFLFGF